MRIDGDLLVTHLRRARSEVVLCAPFIKAPVLGILLNRIAREVNVRVATRWRAEEIAAGVSDLEIYDLIASRSNTDLRLVDNLHAKLYVADGECLAGSANLTATALGWSTSPNLELLVPIDAGCDPVVELLERIARAPEASVEDRDAMARQVAALPPRHEAPAESESVDELTTAPWLPTCAAPGRLYTVYRNAGGDRLTDAVVAAGIRDLAALGLPSGLGRADFNKAVARALRRMPAVHVFIEAADRDLPDEEALRLMGEFVTPEALSAPMLWRILQEWLTQFFADEFELTPQSWVIRKRPGVGRR